MAADEYGRRSRLRTVTRALNDLFDVYLALNKPRDWSPRELREVYGRIEELYIGLALLVKNRGEKG